MTKLKEKNKKLKEKLERYEQETGIDGQGGSTMRSKGEARRASDISI